jgi:selenocysteine lyase/cysteine desulfurase
MSTSNGTIDWQAHRSEFPATERLIYFNNAAVSPMSTRVREAIDTFSNDLMAEGYLCIERAFERIAEVRAAAALLIGCSTEEIAFIKNTTQGVLLAANGIRGVEGSSIVMPSIEFPANVYPWLALEKKGAEIRMVEPEEGRTTAEMLIDACDGSTRVVTVSAVQFSNGYRIDLGKLGNFCREKGIYLHVDGIQIVGMLDIDVKELKIDFLSTGGHKWLLTPPGTGFFYCRKELIEEIDIWNPGWTGVEDFWNFLEYRQPYRKDASRFEEGATNMHGVYGLGASIDRFLEIGMDRIEKRILTITDLLEKGLEALGYTITSPRKSGERSGIICFAGSDKDPESIMQELLDSGVAASVREGSIRLSPHFYNDAGEVERFLEILK